MAHQLPLVFVACLLVLITFVDKLEVDATSLEALEAKLEKEFSGLKKLLDTECNRKMFEHEKSCSKLFEIKKRTPIKDPIECCKYWKSVACHKVTYYI